MKPSGITFQHTTDGIAMTAEAKYEGLHSVSAVPLWKGCAPGTTAVTFEYGEGILRRFVVDEKAFRVIRECLQLDLGMVVNITDVLRPTPRANSATYSLFADIVGALFADKVNTMHREFAIWSDNLDKIIDTRVAEYAPKSYRDSMKGEIAAGSVVGAWKEHLPVRKAVKAQAKPDIAPNTMREFLVDFISHSDMVREALRERRHKADESDKLLQMNTAPQWDHEIYTHSEMVIAAHRLLKVIP